MQASDMIEKLILKLLFVAVTLMLSSSVYAISFSADAVQIREGQFSHARMFWSDGRVRFEYLDNGVPMAQIYDTKNNKVIWLDTENKLYVKKDLPPGQAIDPMVKESRTSSNPCDLIEDAECTRLKETVLNGRNTVKWLVTMQYQGMDRHMFQWIDKQYEVVVRQENPDSSVMEVSIDDGQEMNGRKVRKLDILFQSEEELKHYGTQWYDSELNIVVRQQYENGIMDELRNIKVESVGNNMFTVPNGYKAFDASALVMEPGEIEAVGLTNN